MFKYSSGRSLNATKIRTRRTARLRVFPYQLWTSSNASPRIPKK